jgi:hypothetical protein
MKKITIRTFSLYLIKKFILSRVYGTLYKLYYPNGKDKKQGILEMSTLDDLVFGNV